MILSCVLPGDVQLSSEDLGRLSRQFGTPAHKVAEMSSRMFAEIRASGSILDSCEPRAERYSH